MYFWIQYELQTITSKHKGIPAYKHMWLKSYVLSFWKICRYVWLCYYNEQRYFAHQKYPNCGEGHHRRAVAANPFLQSCFVRPPRQRQLPKKVTGDALLTEEWSERPRVKKNDNSMPLSGCLLRFKFKFFHITNWINRKRL